MFKFLGSLMKAAPRVDPAMVVAKVAAGEALLIDVREDQEVRLGGKAKGAMILPLSRLHLTADPTSGHFDKRLAQAKKAGTPIYLYCASGARSGRAAAVMRSHGFDAVYNLGSLAAWQSGGGAVGR